jgi:hypothetical protein
MDPTQLAQLQQLQSMYGQGGFRPTQGMQFQPMQVQNRPLAPAGGGGSQAAPAAAPPSGGGGGGGGGAPQWAQTLMPLMKGLQGMVRPQAGAPAQGPMPNGSVIPAQPALVPSGIGNIQPGGTEMSGVANGIVNSWPYAR